MARQEGRAGSYQGDPRASYLRPKSSLLIAKKLYLLHFHDFYYTEMEEAMVYSEQSPTEILQE